MVYERVPKALKHASHCVHDPKKNPKSCQFFVPKRLMFMCSYHIYWAAHIGPYLAWVYDFPKIQSYKKVCSFPAFIIAPL